MRKRFTPHTWKLVVVANDFHVPFHHTKALRLFMRLLRDEQPDWLILNGDLMDFWSISPFDKTPRVGVSFEEEIRQGKRILRAFRRAVPKARITWLEGNHELWLRKFLLKNARALYGLSALSVPELFGLRELGITYQPCSPTATRFTDNFIRVGKLYVGHWNKVAKHGGFAAKGLVADKGVSLLQGHTHRFGAHARTTVDGRVLYGFENFCMCELSASYVARPNWQLGFSAVYLEPGSGRFQWVPIPIERDRFVWKDREYHSRSVRRIRK